MASFVGVLFVPQRFVPEPFMRLGVMRRSASRLLRGRRGEKA